MYLAGPIWGPVNKKDVGIRQICGGIVKTLSLMYNT